MIYWVILVCWVLFFKARANEKYKYFPIYFFIIGVILVTINKEVSEIFMRISFVGFLVFIFFTLKSTKLKT